MGTMHQTYLPTDDTDEVYKSFCEAKQNAVLIACVIMEKISTIEWVRRQRKYLLPGIIILV